MSPLMSKRETIDDNDDNHSTLTIYCVLVSGIKIIAQQHKKKKKKDI